MTPSTIIEETKIPKIGKHSHINSDGNLSLDIPVARQDFTATLAAPLPYYATLVVLFNTTVAAVSLLTGTLLLGQSTSETQQRL